MPGTRSEPSRAPISAIAVGAQPSLPGRPKSRISLAGVHLDEPAADDLLLDLVGGRRAPELQPRIEHDVVELGRRPLAIRRRPLGADADRDERLGDDVEVLALGEMGQRLHGRRDARVRGNAVEHGLPVVAPRPLEADLLDDRASPLEREHEQKGARRGRRS